MSAYRNILFGILGNDNELRRAAEAELSQLQKSNPKESLFALVQELTSQEPEIRSLSAVLLRGTLIRKEYMWKQLSTVELNSIRGQLLHSLSIETESYVLHKKVELGMFPCQNT